MLAAVVLFVPGYPSPTVAQSFDHAVLDTVLVRFVRDGRVDYTALKIGREPLDAYLDQVASVAPDEFAGWPEAERIAFLLNVYNAYTLQTIIDNYPIKAAGFFKKLTHPKLFAMPDNSIRQIDGVFDGIKHEVAGRELTLDEIEHGTLRSDYNEPRIHFALVCAAVSCPPLREEAYSGERLDEQLDEQGQRFLNDPRLNRIEIDGGRVHLSKIFEWFGEDFHQFARDGVGYAGDESINGVLTFVSRYLLDRDVVFLEGGEYKVDFLKYDWTLNDQAIAAVR
jgi:hypothetical protein